MPFLQNNSPNIDFLRMKRGKDLTEAEKKIIDTLSKNKFTHNQIAKEINRPRSTITCFLKYKANRGERNHCGRKTQVPERLKRNILKLATRDKMSTRNISNSVSSNLSHMTVYRHLKGEKHIQYGKIVAEDRLTKTHLMKRLKWAEKYQTFDKEWQNIIFSDEKSGILMVPMDTSTFGMINVQKIFCQKFQTAGSLFMSGVRFAARKN